MRALSSFEWPNLWEKGSTLHPLDRGLLLLTAALPETSPEEFADWPLGRRNRELFALQRNWFGNRLFACADCSHCGEQMEFELDCNLLIPCETSSEQDSTVVFRGETYRVPTSRDLAFAVSGESDGIDAATRLLQSCRLGPHDAVSLSEEDIVTVGDLMALADPGGETRIGFQCETCDHEQEEVLDIGSFLWVGIVAQARRLLREVHALASAYGWSEEQVLSLGAGRRRFYLEMVEA